MKNKLFAVVDLETSGGRPRRDRITEVGIVLFDGEQVVETFDSLINPECPIPPGITELTGITNDMVADQPRFHEVAREVVRLTQDAIFVAHNVRFDYNFVREEFARLGYNFQRKQLCTVRLMRKTFPGLGSYSLGKLINYFGLEVSARHRALADAQATTELLGMALRQEASQEQVQLLVNMGIKESKLPAGISLDQIQDLPESCGVYYFYDQHGTVLYVGKSINIKKRVAEHFADKTTKGRQIQRLVADISFEETGSELIALLLENQEIKRLNPQINRAQRQSRFPFAIHTYENDRGYRCFDVVRNSAKARKDLDIVCEYPTLSRAKGRLNLMRKQFELCSAFTHLFPSKSACFHFHLKQCHGACAGHEEPHAYNERAEQARERMRTVFDEDFILMDRGRVSEEMAVVLVEEGRYQGFGYLSDTTVQSVDQIRDVIRPSAFYPETTRIIQRFLSDHPKAKVISLSNS